MAEDQNIIIAGGGIGGLSAAIALALKNIPVTLLERGKALCEVGAGIQVSPNATGILQDWGVWDHLTDQAVIPPKIQIRSGASGSLLSELETSAFLTRYNAPYMVVHRADIQRALYDRACQLDLIDIKDFHAVQSVSQSDNGVSLTCQRTEPDGTITDNVEIKGAALIGADGVWSKIRTDHLGNAPAAYSGKTAWRTTLPMQMVMNHIARNNVNLWIAAKAHLVHYPLVGGHMMNIVAIVNDDWQEEGWNAEGDAAWLNQRFARWPMEIRELLAERENWLKWALCGVDPSQPWTKGKVALLGDAAHAMLPFMAQGAVMAIEDAQILARALDEVQGPTEKALKAYENARKDRVCKVVERARKNGDLYHMQGPMATARNIAMRLMPKSKLLDQFDWIYRWKPSDVTF
ncbi:MAG: FAD-dependent monooxygenase [Cohaesibacter sp.]|jgi:salicylate hydroxylase|nr:FAD-dependent monooxygenase [Cohaesibacter sp.]